MELQADQESIEGRAARRSPGWQIASVTDIRPETAGAKTFALALPNWVAHRAGQHYDIRLTAGDGYQAQRSYSIASEPERGSEISEGRLAAQECIPCLSN